MRITHLPAANRVAAPWKNGGGVTRELAVHPLGAGMTDFLWRVSIADVASAGPFSVFPEVDRVLTVLEGAVRLEVAGQVVSLSAASTPFAFAGDVATQGEPIGGAMTDLNVMTRRGRYRAEVRRASGSIEIAGDTVLIIAETPVAICDVRLARHDALRLDDAKGARIDIGSAPMLLIEFSADTVR